LEVLGLDSSKQQFINEVQLCSSLSDVGVVFTYLKNSTGRSIFLMTGCWQETL